MHILYGSYGIQFSLSDNSLIDECDVVIANLKYCSLKIKEHILWYCMERRAYTAALATHSRSRLAAAVPSAAVVRSGLHARVMLKRRQANALPSSEAIGLMVYPSAGS
jgi:hypothetical protein